ncbi:MULTISPECIES: hypothetical protein [unclassified Bacillus (in: firmicutes)]|uniref:hypothetical protein n=1 Tax=unclassified Bacillus (in: firmicutes) TaxID=185979 RepID=UPI0008E0CFB6|nr:MULTISPECIES: hypothetical protein [unclassified Bacillus (in: firmicutes)]SFJ64364.1 hypothetical protein SAMN04488574_12050 [Bacillus sp. 71mf]SFT13507.1 hypothetical protein SAMN04488145_1135 [Bacillus sp. 103mf]
MQMFTTEVERIYRCTAIVVTGEDMYEFRLRSTEMGVVVHLLDEEKEEWSPLCIETFIDVSGSAFPDEESKERFRVECNSETGWILQMYGEDFGSEHQRPMTPGELRAFEFVNENIPDEIVIAPKQAIMWQ